MPHPQLKTTFSYFYFTKQIKQQTATLLKTPAFNTTPIDFTVREIDNRSVYLKKRAQLNK